MNLQEYDLDLVARIMAYDLPIFDSLTPVVFDIDLGSPMDFSEPVFEGFFFRLSPHDVDKLRHRHLFVGVLQL